jgi:SAM-dependent methyltransferase
MTERFYDALAEDYHLVYGANWDAAVERQGAALAALIQELVPGASAVLDCSCGIGTQALGLARLGYRVVGSDVSEGAIDRARREAGRLGVDADFVVADFRDLSAVDGEFDVVISCDNAVPHLLDEDDVPRALAQMRAKLRPAGALVLTMRDFDRALVDRPAVAPPVVVRGSPRRVLVRLHDWDEDRPSYTVRYLLLTESAAGWAVEEHAVRYRAITRAELTAAARAAGFDEIAWPDVTIVGGQQVLTARGARQPGVE